MVGKAKSEHYKNRAEGFGVVELLVIVVVIAVIGFIGYAFYATKKVPNEIAKTYNQSSSSKTSKSSSSQSSSSPKSCEISNANGKYVMRSATGGQLSFAYPTGWKADACNYSGLSIGSPDFAIQTNNEEITSYKGVRLFVMYWTDKMTGSLDDNVPTQGGDTSVANVAGAFHTTVSGMPAVKVPDESSDGGLRAEVITFAKDDYQYTLRAEWNPKTNASNPYPNVLDDLASSIKFSN